MDGEAPTVDTPPPRLGEHTQSLLQELGYSAAEIEALGQEKAI